MAKPKKQRVDILLVERGLLESQSLAQRMVMAGQVRANGQVVAKPSSKVPLDVDLTVDHGPRFVSRGGEKLAGAFDAFPLNVQDAVCADVGASTGGFTDCLLQNGAAKVYAIDVGHGILHWKMRSDPRVVVMERTNARYVEALPDPIRFFTIDASFISLKVLLPIVRGWLTEMGEGIVLVKPQFEAERHDVAKGDGVIRDPDIHRRVLEEVLGFAVETGYHVRGLVQSPIHGPKGNVEFLAWLSLRVDATVSLAKQVDALFEI